MLTMARSVRPAGRGLQLLLMGCLMLGGCSGSESPSEASSASTSLSTEVAKAKCVPNERVEQDARKVKELQDEVRASYAAGASLGTAPDRIVAVTESALIGHCEADAHAFCAESGMTCEVWKRDGAEVFVPTDQSTLSLVWVQVEGDTVAVAEVPWSG